MDKKTLERNSTGSSKQHSKLTSGSRITPAYSGQRLRTQSRSEHEHNQSKNRQRSTEDDIPEDPDTASMSPRTKANKEAVFKKLRLFYMKKYPEFQIGKYLYKEENNSKKRSNSMETGDTEPYFNVHHSSSKNNKGQATGFEDFELMEKVRKLKQMKGGNYSNKKYEKVTSKVDSGMGSPRSPPTKMYSMDSSPSSLRKERMGNKKESHNTFNLDGGTHETSVDLNESSRKDLHAPRLPLIRAQSINCEYPMPNTRSPSPSISMTRREIKGRVQRSQTFNQSRIFNSPVLKAIHDSPVIKPQNGFDLANESSKQQSPDMKGINQFTFEMIPEFDNMSPVQGALNPDSPITNSPEILVAKNYAIPSNYSPVLSAATNRDNFKRKTGRTMSFSLDKSQAKNLMNQSLNMKAGPKKVRADPLLQIKNDFNKMKQTMNQTYTEVKEKSVPAKIDWLVYHTHKDYNKIERRLGDTKPRLYNFEDYIKSVYGKSFSTDEYGMAMKPHRLAVNPAYHNAKRDQELRELINQVKKEGFDIVEK